MFKFKYEHECCCWFFNVKCMKGSSHSCLISLSVQLPSCERICLHETCLTKWMKRIYCGKVVQRKRVPDLTCRLFVCDSSQGGQWLSWCNAARLGHWDRSVFTRPHGPCGCSALCPVWRAAGGQRSLWLHGQSVGPRDRDLPPYAAGPHQQSVLITGGLLPSITGNQSLHRSILNLKGYSRLGGSAGAHKS